MRIGNFLRMQKIIVGLISDNVLFVVGKGNLNLSNMYHVGLVIMINKTLFSIAETMTDSDPPRTPPSVGPPGGADAEDPASEGGAAQTVHEMRRLEDGTGEEGNVILTPEEERALLDSEPNDMETDTGDGGSLVPLPPPPPPMTPEEKTAYNRNRRRAGREKARSFKNQHAVTFFRLVFGPEDGERFQDFLEASKCPREWFDKVGVVGFVNHLIGSSKNINSAYEGLFQAVGDCTDLAECEKLFHGSRVVSEGRTMIRHFGDWQQGTWHLASECVPKRKASKRARSVDSGGSRGKTDRPAAKKPLVYVTPGGRVVTTDQAGNGDSAKGSEGIGKQQLEKALGTVVAEQEQALADCSKSSEKPTEQTYKEAVKAQAEAETNPHTLLIYHEHPSNPAEDKAPMLQDAWNKWFGYLNQAILRYEANALKLAIQQKKLPELVRVARSGFVKDHGVLVPRDQFSKDFLVTHAPNIGQTKKNDKGESIMEPGVNGLRVKAWPLAIPTVVLRLWFPDAIKEEGLPMDDLLQLTMFKSGIHPGTDLKAFEGAEALYWDSNSPNILCFTATLECVAAIMSNRNSLERAYGCGPGMLYAGLKVQPVFYKNKRLDNDSKLVYGYFSLPPPMPRDRK